MSGYFGGKDGAGVYQAIISQFPPHDLYVETHLGGGSMMRFKPPALRSIGVDLNQSVLDKFECPYPVELVCRDAESFIDDIDYAGSRVLLYVDPPYVLSTRTSRKRYPFDYTDADHVRLLTKLRELPCSIVISGYPCSLYDDLVGDWRTVEFQAMTRGGVRTEKLWMNYPAGNVHWHTYAGQNFTDRQRIKRKAERWAANYKALPPAERAAILSALLGTA